MQCAVSGSNAAEYAFSFELKTAGFAACDSHTGTFTHGFYYTQRRAHNDDIPTVGEMDGTTLVPASGSIRTAIARTDCGTVGVQEEHNYTVSLQQ